MDSDQVLREKEEAEFVCMNCSFFCNDKKAFLEHLNNKNNHKKNKKTGQELKLGCPHCEYTGFKRNALLAHTLKWHGPDETFHCKNCSFKTTSKRMYDSHQHVHTLTGKSLHKCDLCDFVTRHKYSLIAHEKIHKGIAEHICSICQASFVLIRYLKEHIRKHTGEKPFKCEFCKAEFAHHSNLLRHKNTLCKNNFNELSVERVAKIDKVGVKPNRKSSVHETQAKQHFSGELIAEISPTASETSSSKQYAMSNSVSIPFSLTQKLDKNSTPGQNLYEERRRVLPCRDSNCCFQFEGEGEDRCKENRNSRNEAHLYDTEVVTRKPDQNLSIITISEGRNSNAKTTSVDPGTLELSITSKSISMPAMLRQEVVVIINPEQQPLTTGSTQNCSSKDESLPGASKKFERKVASKSISVPALLPQEILENWTPGQNPYFTRIPFALRSPLGGIECSEENLEIDDGMLEASKKADSNRCNMELSKDGDLTDAYTCPECSFTCYREVRLLRHRLKNHFQHDCHCLSESP